MTDRGTTVHAELTTATRGSEPDDDRLTLLDMGRIKTTSQSFGCPPFGADHHIVSRLVPEVVPKGCCLARVLPITDHLKCLTVQQNETTSEDDSRFTTCD